MCIFPSSSSSSSLCRCRCRRRRRRRRRWCFNYQFFFFIFFSTLHTRISFTSNAFRYRFRSLWCCFLLISERILLHVPGIFFDDINSLAPRLAIFSHTKNQLFWIWEWCWYVSYRSFQLTAVKLVWQNDSNTNSNERTSERNLVANVLDYVLVGWHWAKHSQAILENWTDHEANKPNFELGFASGMEFLADQSLPSNGFQHQKSTKILLGLWNDGDAQLICFPNSVMSLQSVSHGIF